MQQSLFCFVEAKLLKNSSVQLVTFKSKYVTHLGFYLTELKWYKGIFLKWVFQGIFRLNKFVVCLKYLRMFYFESSRKGIHRWIVLLTEICLRNFNDVKLGCILGQDFLFLVTSNFPDT